MVTEVSAMFVATTTCANNKQQAINKQTNKQTINKQTNNHQYQNTITGQKKFSPFLCLVESCETPSTETQVRVYVEWNWSQPHSQGHMQGPPHENLETRFFVVHGQKHTCSVYGKPPYSGRISSCIPFVDRLACSLREEDRESKKGSRGGVTKRYVT